MWERNLKQESVQDAQVPDISRELAMPEINTGWHKSTENGEISLWVSLRTGIKQADGNIGRKRGNTKRKHKKRNYLTVFIG